MENPSFAPGMLQRSHWGQEKPDWIPSLPGCPQEQNQPGWGQGFGKCCSTPKHHPFPVPSSQQQPPETPPHTNTTPNGTWKLESAPVVFLFLFLIIFKQQEGLGGSECRWGQRDWGQWELSQPQDTAQRAPSATPVQLPAASTTPERLLSHFFFLFQAWRDFYTACFCAHTRSPGS